ncbi:MAG: hypothetical protein IJR98_03990 [Synergistaceae bacterium]|nr:hypothetical protein [Synergistaceae bacterium]
MTSQDNERYVTVEVFNDGMAKINSRLDTIDATLTAMQAEIRTFDKRVEVNSVKVDELHYFMGIGFTVMAIVVGLVGFLMTLAPMFREMYQDHRREKNAQHVTRSEVADMIEAAVARALGAKN